MKNLKVDDNIELIKDQFFVIDSDNLYDIKSRLYGIAIDDNGEIIQDISENRDKIKYSGGTYVFINVANDRINIYQDIDGSYGLYLFSQDSYFAISNSFIRLVEHIRNDFELSLNKDYAITFISQRQNSIAYSETLINEISALPRNAYIVINKHNQTFEVKKWEITDNSIELDSEEGFQIIDKWYNKWTQIIRNLKSQTNHITVDFSGGFDSRVAFLVTLGAKINLNEICIHSANDDLHTHTEDFKIASAIANHFGFLLDKKTNIPWRNFNNFDAPLAISWYAKSGFHKQMYWKFKYATEPVFHLGGMNGEVVNGHLSFGELNGEEVCDVRIQRALSFDPSFREPVRKIVNNLLDKICSEYRVTRDCPYMSFLVYRETSPRYHFGKTKVESLLSNTIPIQPLMDPCLRLLKTSTSSCADKKLLMAVLFVRYCPDLLNFPFEGGRAISDKTIEFAKKINLKYPLSLNRYENLFKLPQPLPIRKVVNYTNVSTSSAPPSQNQLNSFFSSVYSSKLFRNAFISYFPKGVYSKIYKDSLSKVYYPLQGVLACISTMQIVDIIHYTKVRQAKIFSPFGLKPNKSVNNYVSDIFNQRLLSLSSGRLDLINLGSLQNSIEVLSSNCGYTQPSWLSPYRKNGFGITLQSSDGIINAKIKIKGNGNLKIIFRGIDKRDLNGARVPVWIECTKLSVNNTELIKSKRLTWHDQPIVFSQYVTNGQVLEVFANWLPCETSFISET